MPRTRVSRDQLSEWMTAEIRKKRGCEGCFAGKVQLLQEPDEAGCNWSDSVVFNTTGAACEICEPAIALVISEARSRFNVAAE